MCLEMVAVIIHWNKLVWWSNLTTVGFNHAIVKQRTLVPEEDNYALCSLTFRVKCIWLPMLKSVSFLFQQLRNIRLEVQLLFPQQLSQRAYKSTHPPQQGNPQILISRHFFFQIAGYFPKLLTRQEMVN